MKRCDVRDVTSAAVAPTYVLPNTTVRRSLVYSVAPPFEAGSGVCAARDAQA